MKILACLFALFGSLPALAEGPAPAAPAGTNPAFQACVADRQKFCPDDKPGSLSIRLCMARHTKELSKPCQEAIDKAKQKTAKGPAEAPPAAEGAGSR